MLNILIDIVLAMTIVLIVGIPTAIMLGIAKKEMDEEDDENE